MQTSELEKSDLQTTEKQDGGSVVCETPEEKLRKHKLAALELAMEAGELLLENGAEIFRVQDTMHRICKYYGVRSDQFFTLSNGIFVSAGDSEEPLFAKVKHLPVSSGRLDWVCAVNQLSREIEQGKYTIEEAKEELQKIREMPGKSIRMRVIAGALGSGSFCCIFGGDMMDMLSAALVGFLLQLFTIYVCDRYLSRIVGAMCGGGFITLLCIILHRIGFGHNLSNMVIGAVMLLVPGLAFVNGIRDIANTDYLAGAVRILDALLRFVCIAVGVGVSFMVYHAVFGGKIL